MPNRLLKVELAQVSLSGLGLIEFSTCKIPSRAGIKMNAKRFDRTGTGSLADHKRQRSWSMPAETQGADLSRFIGTPHCSSAAYRKEK